MLNKQEILQWKEKGYVLAKNIVDNQLIDKCQNFMKKNYNIYNANNDFGSNGKLEFPSGYILDLLTINENLINCVEKLLNTKDILLVQSDTWCKIGSDNYSKNSNNDQRMHMDYGNNMFLHPSDWNNPEAVSAIIYLSNVEDTGGYTCAVPKEGKNDIAYKPPYIKMPGQNKYDFYNDRIKAEKSIQMIDKEAGIFRKKLYNREEKIIAKIGDILFYRLDLWHRGTPVKKNKIRYVMNLIWKKKECYWINIWNPGWTRKMYYGYLENLISSMTVKQRNMLGFPKPGDNYWTKEKLHFLLKRYPKMNIEYYLSKL